MIKPKAGYKLFTQESDMLLNRKSWGFPLKRDLIYYGRFVDKPTPIKLIGYRPKTDIAGSLLNNLSDRSIRELETTATYLIIEVNDQLHDIHTDYLAQMQKSNFNKK